MAPKRKRNRNTPKASREASEASGKRVTLLVLGDVGRSPRMQYHALSFAEQGYFVDFVGYEGSIPMENVVNSAYIKLQYIQAPWKLPPGLPKLAFLLYAPFKVLFQILQLFWILLFTVSKPDYIFLQNPPAIPTLLIAQCVAFLRGAKLIIDWHNFGYTILGLNLGMSNFVVKFAKWYEKVFGRKAYAHLCVTKAMAKELQESWGIEGNTVTLYDRPPSHFRRLAVEEIHQLLSRLNLRDLLIQQGADQDWIVREPGVRSTLLTVKTKQNSPAQFRADRPALIVSSTSWTEDEDFSVLLEAAKEYNQRASQPKSGLPNLIFVITGKGPLREMYEQKIRDLSMTHVCIGTLWLSAEDYPALLGAADLGVCLHKSSSGLDLPMKVVDMFGCGLPVCAIDFSCLDELVQHQKNGLVFKNHQELYEQLQMLFTLKLNENPKLEEMRRNIAQFQRVRWSDNWNQVVRPLIKL
ncbi:UDP-Glycosyltransferase/glycogen phosphorylase [Basidiobolus meristosporus CBS 931.73]|uniref:Chitobiosyldiphosphodolichol beta-mannosyltransferase n=1 Tax=Basidiobolus meristosporus CBS 931.73 TaxID=1314790 RepID=A0A1Y1Y3G4_9FUNG|nr:UDP-Glycosyltransferase/glycogen phosphorylase [Basidiobolus meristosporus CBS 931.73]|eukprot:ORX92561.1 UDP-Glycosyltransferase/glycogen phosphorylase [Basidiobolus meristosporus CBS 931.73]